MTSSWFIGRTTLRSEVSYVDSDGVKSADRADARQQLPISGNSTLVDDQHLQASQTAQDAGQRAVQPGGRQIVEQARQPSVEDAVAFAGGLIAERAGDEGLRSARSPAAATRQVADQRAVEAARQSRSSRQAVWRSRARFSRLARAVLARSAVSRSTSRASWSSKLSWLRSGWRSRSSRPRAMPYRRSRRNASWVGCFMVSGPCSVPVVGGSAQVGVLAQTVG